MFYSETDQHWLYWLTWQCFWLVSEGTRSYLCRDTDCSKRGNNTATADSRSGSRSCCKNNILLVYVHARPTVNGVLKDFLKKGDSSLSETNLLQKCQKTQLWSNWGKIFCFVEFLTVAQIASRSFIELPTPGLYWQVLDTPPVSPGKCRDCTLKSASNASTSFPILYSLLSIIWLYIELALLNKTANKLE